MFVEPLAWMILAALRGGDPGDRSAGAPTDPGVRIQSAPGSSPHVAARPSRLWTTRA